jgi:hypothetical protein
MRVPGGLYAAGGVLCVAVAVVLVLERPGPDDAGDISANGVYAVPQAASVAPDQVRLPDGRAVAVSPISVDPHGALQPPARVTEAGWWRGGAALGDPTGTLVLAGHVDARGQGIGSFAELWQAEPGQRVSVRGRDAREVSFRITGRRVYPRTSALPASIFATDGGPRLALITCAGRFDRRTRHYDDTLVVYAAPA